MSLIAATQPGRKWPTTYLLLMICAAAASEATAEKPRFIITARALEVENETEDPPTDRGTIGSAEEATEAMAEQLSTDADDAGKRAESTESVGDDLKSAPSKLHIKTDSRPARADHEVLYARLKQPIRTVANQPLPQDSEKVGSLFGRPYSWPFQLRQPAEHATPAGPTLMPAEQGLIPVPLRSPSPTLPPASDTDDGIGWIKPNRWEKEKASNQRLNMTRVLGIEAECQNDYMKIRMRFNGSFTGLIYSTGFAYDQSCVYINGTGRDFYEFYIQLNRCGTLGGDTHNLDSRKQPTKSFMWNTLSIQYSPLIEEEWDEHYKVTCEYGYDYWKTVSFPFLNVEVATGNPLTFTLTPPECHMEIRQGFGNTGTRVTGPVRVGDPLTLIIYMRSQYDGFDLIVSDCYAHNGGAKKIQLIDPNGCPINEKLISRFRGTWTDTGLYETQVFAYMKAFRFTGSPALYIECDVRMCHGHCPNQPCYWRTGKKLNKRDATSPAEAVNASLSENISLFQSLQVMTDDAELSSTRDATSTSVGPGAPNADEICLKPQALGAAVGLAVLFYLALGLLSCFTCIRLRRSQSCHAQSADIYAPPYTSSPNYAKQRRY